MQHVLRNETSLGQTRRSLLTNLVQIGRGSFGTVYQAKHTQWGTVAYKRLNAEDMFIESSCIRNVKREMQAHGHLRHPNITQMIAIVCEANWEFGLVLWHEKYGSAFNFINEFCVGWQWKVEMMYQISLALNYLHTLTSPVIHGDIKVCNVLVGDGFATKLSDFGLSCWRDYSTAKSHVFPRGTLTHIAPERFRDINAKRNEKTDVYSYGFMVWELLTGKLPFAGSPDALIIDAVKSGSRPDCSEIAADVPSSVRDIMERCWADRPDRRPSSSAITNSVEEVRAEIEYDIEVCRHQLHKQDGCRKLSDCSKRTGDHLPIENRSSGSWNFAGVDVPRESGKTHSSAPQEVLDSSWPRRHMEHQAGAAPPENNQSDDSRGPFSNDAHRTPTPLPRTNFPRRALPPDFLQRGQQSLRVVGQATCLSANTPDVEGPVMTRLPTTAVPALTRQRTSSPHEDTAVAARTSASREGQDGAIARPDQRLPSDGENIGHSIATCIPTDDDGVQVPRDKKKKSRSRKTNPVVSIGRPTNFRHVQQFVGDPQNGIYVDQGTTDVDRALVVGNAQLHRSADNFLNEDFEVVVLSRRQRPGSPSSDISLSTVRYNVRQEQRVDPALEY